MAHIAGWPEWRQLIELAEDDAYHRQRLAGVITEAITPRTIEDLIGLCRRGAPAETYEALGLLGGLARAKDRRFRRPRIASWLRTVRHLARKTYPSDRIGFRAVAFLREQDAAAAERIMVSADLTKVSEAIARRVVLDLGTLGTPGCIARLERLAKGRSRVAGDARTRLAFTRGLSPRQVAVAAAEWRRHKTYRSLERLSPWMSRMYGKPIHAVAKVLGPPTSEDDAFWTYVPRRPASAQGIALTLYVDDDGKFQYHKIK